MELRGRKGSGLWDSLPGGCVVRYREQEAPAQVGAGGASPQVTSIAWPAIGRGGASIAVGLLVLIGIAALIAPNAFAVQVHPLKSTFPVASGKGIGIDESSGNVFVRTNGSEPAENAVRIFGSAGGPPTGVSNPIIAGFAPSGEPNAVAVDNAAGSPSLGDLYVVDVGSSAIKKYRRGSVSEEYEFVEALSAAPAFSEPLGVAVDSGGNVFVADFGSASVVEFAPNGTEIRRIEVGPHGGAPSSVAVDAEGNLYVQVYGSGQVLRFEANGSGEIEAGTVPTQILAAGATGVAVNTNTNHLFVALGGHVNEYSQAGLLEGEFGSGLTGTARIAVNATTGDIYVVDSGAGDVAIFSTIVVPSVVTTAATDVEATGEVNLTGTVNPDGVPVTECLFEYGATDAYGGDVQCDKSAIEIGGGEVPVGVAAGLSGLQPGVYHFRLVAANANGSNQGEDKTFAIPGPPSVFGESANPTETEADLRAEIAPSNAETSYRFEFGITDSYGESTPVKIIPAGSGVVSVAAHISGLIAGQSYHFRVVATNEVDTTEGADRTFITKVPSLSSCPESTEESPGFRSYLPECRAYELVSPTFTGGIALNGAPEAIKTIPVSQDGQRAMVSSLGAFAGQESGSSVTNRLGVSYVLTRTSAGWRPSALNPSPGRFPFQRAEDADSELKNTLWRLGETTVLTGSVDYAIRKPDGTFVSIGPDTHEVNPGEGYLPDSPVRRPYLGASADLSRIVFSLRAGEPSQRGALWPGDETLTGEAYSLYEYSGVGNTEPRLVAVDNEGPLSSNQEASLIGQCGVQLGSANPAVGEPGDFYNAVSPSGFAVFFTVLEGPCSNETENGTGPSVRELYARVEGSDTLAISEPSLSVPGRECTGICRESQNEESGHARSPGRFLGASADGHRVYFLTSQPLVDSDADEGPDLYLAELDSTQVTRLIDVSEGDEDAPTPGEGANVLGVSRVSQDGSRVYFVAKGVLTPEANGNGESAIANANNLYLYEPASGRTAFVARLSADDADNWSFFDSRPVQASAADGRFLAFSSNAHPLGTGDSSAVSQLFRYDAQSGALVRVSVGQRGTYLCPQTGELEVGYNCNGNVQGSLQAPVLKRRDFYSGSRAFGANAGVSVTSDGTVFFQSRTALTPAVANGYPGSDPGLFSVYEYKDGQVYLISDGQEVPTGAVESGGGVPFSSTELSGALADGNGVLFFSLDRLVPQDSDSVISIYDARIDGGFPVPPGTAQCAGEACRTPSTGPPLPPSAGSSSFQGDGNLKTRKKCAKGKQRHGNKCVKKKHKHKAPRGNSRRTKPNAGGSR